MTGYIKAGLCGALVYLSAATNFKLLDILPAKVLKNPTSDELEARRDAIRRTYNRMMSYHDYDTSTLKITPNSRDPNYTTVHFDLFPNSKLFKNLLYSHASFDTANTYSIARDLRKTIIDTDINKSKFTMDMVIISTVLLSSNLIASMKTRSYMVFLPVIYGALYALRQYINDAVERHIDNQSILYADKADIRHYVELLNNERLEKKYNRPYFNNWFSEQYKQYKDNQYLDRIDDLTKNISFFNKDHGGNVYDITDMLQIINIEDNGEEKCVELTYAESQQLRDIFHNKYYFTRLDIDDISAHQSSSGFPARLYLGLNSLHPDTVKRIEISKPCQKDQYNLYNITLCSYDNIYHYQTIEIPEKLLDTNDTYQKLRYICEHIRMN